MDRPRTTEKYDCPTIACDKSCIIFTNTRTGSSWLSIGLYRAGLGVPMEYFHQDYIQQFVDRNAIRPHPSEDFSQSYIRTITDLRTTPNGVFGVKIHTNQWVDFWKTYEPEHKQNSAYYRQKLERSFINPHFIFLYRKDMLSQAISMYIAQESESWSSEVPAKKQVEYDFDTIKSYLEVTMENTKFVRSIQQYTSFPKMTLTYEELKEDYYGSLRSIASFLNKEIVLTENVGNNTIEKQGNLRNEEWKSRFLATLKKGRL